MIKNKKLATFLKKSGSMADDTDFFSLLAENATDVIWVSDLDYNTLYISPSVEVVLGYKPEDYAKKGMAERYPPKHLEVVLGFIENKLKKESVSYSNAIEAVHFHSDGRQIWLSQSVTIIRNKDGVPCCLAGIMRDISTSKNVEAQLTNFFDLNLDLLCIADMQGNFVRVNKEWENLLGYKSEDLEQSPYLSYVHPDDIEPTIQAMEKLGNQGKLMNFINRYRCHDGGYRSIEWRSNIKDGMIYAAARDISHRTDAETSLLDARKQAEKAKDPNSIFIQKNGRS